MGTDEQRRVAHFVADALSERQSIPRQLRQAREAR
jgi:hypothetical protein